jgi:hypothetical protein
MKWFVDFYSRKICLTDERLEHIELDHPEMSGQIDKIGETLASPDFVVKSRTDAEAELFYKHYSETPVGGKYLCVIVKIRGDDFFVLTAYFTDTIKRGETLWTRK